MLSGNKKTEWLVKKKYLQTHNLKILS